MGLSEVLELVGAILLVVGVALALSVIAGPAWAPAAAAGSAGVGLLVVAGLIERARKGGR